MKLITQCLTTVFLLLISWQASANLLINPTRVSLAHGERSTEITLINTSQVTNTYRMEWVEKQAKQGGGYDDLTDEQAARFPTSSQMIRFSPRQVTLAPNERQTVRIAVRRPSDLAEGEYHTNVVMSVLAGRSLVLCREGLADPQAAQALVDAWHGHCVELDAAEKNAFAGNCIVVREPELLMSQSGVDSLRPATRQALAAQGWQLQPVPLSQIELAGGSLRCCVGEVF